MIYLIIGIYIIGFITNYYFYSRWVRNLYNGGYGWDDVIKGVLCSIFWIFSIYISIYHYIKDIKDIKKIHLKLPKVPKWL